MLGIMAQLEPHTGYDVQITQHHCYDSIHNDTPSETPAS
jgi:hypothetical protein